MKKRGCITRRLQTRSRKASPIRAGILSILIIDRLRPIELHRADFVYRHANVFTAISDGDSRSHTCLPKTMESLRWRRREQAVVVCGPSDCLGRWKHAVANYASQQSIVVVSLIGSPDTYELNTNDVESYIGHKPSFYADRAYTQRRVPVVSEKF